MPLDDLRTPAPWDLHAPAACEVSLRSDGADVVALEGAGDEERRSVLAFVVDRQHAVFRFGLARHLPLAVAHVAEATGVDRDRVRAHLDATRVVFAGESIPALRLLGAAYARKDGVIVSSESVRLSLVVALWRGSSPDDPWRSAPVEVRLRDALGREGLGLSLAEIRAQLAWLGIGDGGTTDFPQAVTRVAPTAWLRDPLLAALVTPRAHAVAAPRLRRSA